MNKVEIVKEFSNILSNVVTKIKLLGEELSNQRVLVKIFIFFSNINYKSYECFCKPLNKEKKPLRVLENIEGVFGVNTKDDNSSKKNSFGGKKGKRKNEVEDSKGIGWKDKYPPYPCCNKKNHTKNLYLFLGYVKKFCNRHQAQVVEEQNKKHLFVDSYYPASNSKEAWVIDNGCTNYMTNSYFSKVTIGNGENVELKDKGVFVVEIPLSSKYILHVLFVFEINQSLLALNTFHFEDIRCTIFDPLECELIMSIKVRDTNFPIKWKQTNMHTFPGVVDDSILWHKRIGYFSYSILMQMSLNNWVYNLPFFEDDVDVCDKLKLMIENKVRSQLKSSSLIIEFKKYCEQAGI
ncbi:hypothetical protein CR513_55998, partial [Mucuna pruriens]